MLDAGRKSHRARALVGDQRLVPARTIGAGLDAPVVIAGEPEFGAARIAGLEQNGGAVAGACLVDLHLMAGADIVEQHRLRTHHEAVRDIGGGVDAKPLQRGGLVDRGPDTAIEGKEPCLVRHPGQPAPPWHQEGPGAVLPGGNHAGLARPGTRRRDSDQIAVALLRTCRRCGEVTVEHRKLHDGVQPTQRLIVDDVFLGLRRKDVGKFEKFGLFAHGTLCVCPILRARQWW